MTPSPSASSVSLFVCRNWLNAPAPEQLKVGQHAQALVIKSACPDMSAVMQGPPLRCRWCPGTLLLNATALRNHMESKRHQNRQKVSEAEPSPICLAEDIQEDESVMY